MASKSYESGFKKYYADRFANVSNETTEEEIASIYDNWASEYDKDLVLGACSVFHKPLAECLDAAIKQVFTDKPKEEIKIVDAAAGTGLVGVELQKLGYINLHALDISQGMLNEAKKTNAYKTFICAVLNDQRIPEIETGEFHALICGGTMLAGHIRPSALVEMIRMVKMGGLVCFNIRDGQLVDYKGKISELESSGKWELFSKTITPFFATDDMPKDAIVLTYKVLDLIS